MHLHRAVVNVFAFAFCVALAPTALKADAAADLEKGRAALQAGKVEAALPLLTSAAQELPQSVEAQLALGECYLKLGEVDKALAQYRKVLALSPEHAAAKRIVDGLTGSGRNYTERMEVARAFAKIGAFKSAEPVLVRAIADAATEEERQSARRLLVEVRLWAGNLTPAFDEAVRLMNSQQHAEAGRALAALALLGFPDSDLASVRRLLDELKSSVEADKEAKADWRGWHNAAMFLLHFEDTIEQSSKLAADRLSAIPVSTYRATVINRLVAKTLAHASVVMGKGDADSALKFAWPLVAGGEAPGEVEIGKPIELKGGWLDQTAAAAPHWIQVARTLAAIGKADFERHGAQAKLAGYWLAAEVIRQAPEAVNRPDQLIQLAAQLASLSRPQADRNPGTPLSAADSLQLVILKHAQALAVHDSERIAIVDLLIGQVGRYQQADDLEAGLTGLISIGADEPIKPGEKLNLVEPFDSLPVGPAHQKLLSYLADRLVELGVRSFQEAAASLATNVNREVNRYDAAAINLYGQLAALYPNTNAAAADAIIQRYAHAESWAAASDAATRFYAHLAGDAGRWAAIRLKLSQAQRVEDQALAAGRQIGKELSPLVKEALAEILTIVAKNPTKANRSAAIQLLEPLVNRYATLERFDLAEGAIAQLSDGEPATPLADWAAWMRIQLLDRQAGRALALATIQLDPRSQPALGEFHQQELEQLTQFVAKYPRSEFLAQAVERVVQIAQTYQNHRAFAVADKILSDFLNAHPKLAFAERIEYLIVQNTVAKATAAFHDRKDKTTPPAKLSEESEAALAALTAFLKKHLTGQFAAAAEQDLLNTVRTLGSVGAGPLAREVLERFSAAVPNVRSPAQWKLYRAATFLGELDRNYGMSLLNPLPPGRASTPGEEALVMAGGRRVDRLKSGGGGSADDIKLAEVRAADAARQFDPAGTPFGGGYDSARPGYGAIRAESALQNAATEFSATAPSSQPSTSDLALAQVRRAQQDHLTTIAMFERQDAREPIPRGDRKDIALPSGPVLSVAEMKRQDEAADQAYAILIELAGSSDPAEANFAEHARTHIHWMFAFFEGQLRADRAVAMIRRYLNDRPTEPARVSLAFRILNDLLVYAAQRQPNDRINKQWLDERHERFEHARREIETFIKKYSDRRDWVQQAQILRIDSFGSESQLAAMISPVRAGGLLLQAAEAVTTLFVTAPDHPARDHLAERLWTLSERLVALGQQEQAIYVLSQIPMYFPTHARANQAVLRQAELYAQNLSNPLRAVETYQEYLGLAGDNENIRSQIFSIAQQLVGKQRYLEALHVFNAFVDSFPTDARAPQALLQIGQTHQANEAWNEAMQAYERILEEYQGVQITPQVKLAMAECHINLSQWRQARKLYKEYAQQYPSDGQAELARQRIEILKNLDRYQTLLADEEVQRNKDDAQFQIGVIVLEKLNNPVKAVAEFRKVVVNFPKSPQADDAQLEIGKALLSLNRLDEARTELLKVAENYPGSPLADDALYLVGQSYERQAQRLAAVTGEKAREEAFERGQRGAYQVFNEQVQAQERQFAARRDMLRREGKKEELDLDEAAQAFRLGNVNMETRSATARVAGIQAEAESALQVANRQDRINEANRLAVATYSRAANEYPLGDMTDDALLRMAQIYETELKDRAAAMETYQKVVKFFPGTPVAEDAAWKVAQFYEQEGNFKEAVDAYRQFIRNYPVSARVADAQFAMAEALEQLGRWVEAMDAYETFRQKFTTHPKVQLALDQINWIKAYRK
ncbi:MAG: tetratricopeptide repeat protein [Pirellulales bacterium]